MSVNALILLAAGVWLGGWGALAALQYLAHFAAGRTVFRLGRFRQTVKWVRASRRVPFARLGQFTYLVETSALEYLGMTRTALRHQRYRFDRQAWNQPILANAMVCTFINAGRYEEALRVGNLLEALDPGAVTFCDERALLKVNLSEALYNLGRWDEALQILEELERKSNAITRAGLLNQRCWILAHTGRAAEALAIHDAIDRSGLPPIFFAEHHFTRALVLLELGRLDDADRELTVGAALAVRASSQRNAIFLQARFAMRRGQYADAEQLYRRGSRHLYKGQGGEALLAWGECLAKLGRAPDTAWQLCVKRDPQSASAQIARRHLTAVL